MKRADLEHILRASKGITGESEFVVIGSQSILGSYPDAPRVIRRSMEADLYPRFRPEMADLIEGSLGRYSQFDQTFGYFADGVSPSTAVLPEGWEERLISVCSENTGGATGWCLDPHDLAFSKLAARREKDLEFVSALIQFKMIKQSRLLRLIAAAKDSALRNKLEEAFNICRKKNSTGA
jgi:hypothetical protein